MPKYLLEVDYTAAGNAGLVKDGGTARQKAVDSMVKSLGGKVESFYFTFGIRDAIVIVELPDNATAAAISIAVSSTGSASYKTTLLLTPAELDAASEKTVIYTPPGA
jgi:uncharacterized protein with GYD domain